MSSSLDAYVPLMRGRPAIGALAALAIAAACGTEPVTLVIELNEVPELVTANPIALMGRVTRMPDEATTIVVTAVGGSAPAIDTTAVDGSFSVAVPLAANVENAITLSAEDASGAVSPPVTVMFRHDGIPPSIVSASPTGDAIPTGMLPTVEVRFSEPVTLNAVGAGIRLVTHRIELSGTSTLSADSLRLTFTPQDLLRQNAVYEMRFADVTDPAGNPPAPSGNACFVTEVTVPARSVVADPSGDLFEINSPTGASASDLVELRLAAYDGGLAGVLEFTTPRTLDPLAVNHLFVVLDLDLDQDGATGFVTQKDSLFTVQFGHAPSGVRAEYLIGLEAFSTGGFPYVGMYTAPLFFTVVDVLEPTFCGDFVGFGTSFTVLGNDDGNFNYVMLTASIEDAGATIDPTPTMGHNTISFAGQFAKRPVTTAAFRVPGLTAQSVRLQRFRR